MEGKTVNVLKAHLALNVEDVARSIEFYKRLLGIEPRKVRTGYAKFDAEQPPLNLTLNERKGVTRGAVSHLGIQVGSTGDVLEMRERWRAAGLATYDEMQTSCCFAVQDKTWVTDPDGNSWEAFVVLEDDLPETAAESCCTEEMLSARPFESAPASCAPDLRADAKTAASSCASPAAEASAISCCGPQGPTKITA
jgi:catechol 2,3-dioxygenase-like lactoylglutathione lyase family enzyme